MSTQHESLRDALIAHFRAAVVSVPTAAQYISVSPRTIYQWQSDPDCPLRLIDLGPRRSGVAVADLAGYIERQRERARALKPKARRGRGRPARFQRRRTPRPLNRYEFARAKSIAKAGGAK